MFSRGGFKVVVKFSDHDSDVFQKGDTKMLAHMLTLLAQYAFVCTFQSTWGVSDLEDVLYDHLTTHLAVLFLGDLACPSVPCDDRGSDCFGRNASLCPR